MTSRKPTSSRQDEAAAWFAASRAGAMLVEKRAEFEAWLEDPRNEAAFDAMQDLWDDLAVLKGARPAQAQPKRSLVVAAIALFFVALGGASVTWLALSGDTTIQTVAGEQRTQSLPDGSIMAVNVASHVSYAIKESSRVIKLSSGEAAFTVKADPDRPFVVHVGAYEVRAIGTAFNVRQRDGAIEVSVSEGTVEICAAGGPNAGEPLASLGAGQLLRLPAELKGEPMALPPPVPVPPAQVSEWRMRVVTYQEATVSDVVADFNRYFEQKLIVDQPGLLDEQITIRLQVEDRDRAIETLASLLDAKVSRTARGDVMAR